MVAGATGDQEEIMNLLAVSETDGIEFSAAPAISESYMTTQQCLEYCGQQG